MAFKSPLDQANVLTLINSTKFDAQKPIIESKPKRYTRSPRLEDYGLSENSGPYAKYKNNYYYRDPEDVDKEISELREKIKNNKNIEFNQDRLNSLSDPNVQKYLKDKIAFGKQFKADFDEYYPTAKQAILSKILSGKDLYKTNYYGDDSNEEYDDIYDSINEEFAKKYGYEGSRYSNLFYPGRTGFPVGPDRDEEFVDAQGKTGYRGKYNVNKYLADLLNTGEVTIDDLKRYLLGK